MRVFICAGEASADAYGAILADELRALRPELSMSGAGGARMRAAQIPLVEDSSTWGVVSIVQALRKAPRLIFGYYRIKHALAQNPGLFVPIDFGYMNIRLSRFAKKRGWKVLYFVPPGSWRRDKQGQDLPFVTDAIATPFPWSADMLNDMGARAYWFGHPIKQVMASMHQGQARLDQIAVLPGSRSHEIDENLPLIAETIALTPGSRRLEFALAPSVDQTAFAEQWRRLSGRADDLFTAGQTGTVLLRSQAALVCSGTATLEAALCRCPMVVIYRLSKSMEREVKLLRFKRPKFVALPNILLDRAVVPELVAMEAVPEAVSGKLSELLEDSNARRAQLAAFEELNEVLGPSDAITQTARLALELIGAA